MDTPGAKDISIPIPDATVKVAHYLAMYPQTFHLPKTLIRSTTDAELNEDYDMDDDDTEWIQKLNKPARKVAEDQFEGLITQFEHLAKETKDIPETFETFGQINTSLSPPLITEVFKYWKGKRELLKCGSLVYPLKVPIRLFFLSSCQ